MDKLFTQTIQSKFNYYFHKLAPYISKPECRFVQESILGILKSQRVILNQIAIHIHDTIGLKKTQERLRRHLSKSGYWQVLIRGHLKAITHRVRAGGYALVDISDIQKKYARMMEGLDRVHDGSQNQIGFGYWLMNIIYVNRQGDKIIPLYNKLYSFACDTVSENSEILRGIWTVIQGLGKRLTWVIDRGGDRNKLIVPLLKRKLNFIIRSTGRRHLYYKGRSRALKWISRRVVLRYRLKARKIKKHKVKYEQYVGGAVPVQFINPYTGLPYENRLWLVVIKGQGKGYSWYLVSSDKTTEQEVVEAVFTGYGYRWKIEEYHRHIKNQFHVENIQLRKFQGLQTMLVLVTIAMYLIYAEISSLHMKMMLACPVKTVAKRKLFEIAGFIYYKIGTIVKNLLARVTAHTFIPSKITRHINPKQLTLGLT